MKTYLVTYISINSNEIGSIFMEIDALITKDVIKLWQWRIGCKYCIESHVISFQELAD